MNSYDKEAVLDTLQIVFDGMNNILTFLHYILPELDEQETGDSYYELYEIITEIDKIRNRMQNLIVRVQNTRSDK